MASGRRGSTGTTPQLNGRAGHAATFLRPAIPGSRSQTPILAHTVLSLGGPVAAPGMS